MMTEETKVYNIEDIQEGMIGECITNVIDILEERGYDAMTQLVGYLMSGDPGYITSYKNAREKITSIERTELLALVLEEYLK